MKASDFDRLTELEKVLARLWDALDGTRQIEVGHDKAGVPYTATENAAPVAREIRAALAEIEALRKSQSTKGSGVDELARQRAARLANSERRATPKRQRR